MSTFWLACVREKERERERRGGLCSTYIVISMYNEVVRNISDKVRGMISTQWFIYTCMIHWKCYFYSYKSLFVCYLATYVRVLRDFCWREIFSAA